MVKFLIALTDPRVKLERAPFDRPEIFVPIDGAAPENTGGRTQLVAQSGVPCPVPGRQRESASGRCRGRRGGTPLPHANFLGISSTPVPGSEQRSF